MDDALFNSIIKYFEKELILKDKDSKESQVRWQKLTRKYILVEGFLVLKN